MCAICGCSDGHTHAHDHARYVDANVSVITANARRVNPAVEILVVSARDGEGMAAWFAWLSTHLATCAGEDGQFAGGGKQYHAGQHRDAVG